MHKDMVCRLVVGQLSKFILAAAPCCYVIVFDYSRRIDCIPINMNNNLRNCAPHNHSCGRDRKKTTTTTISHSIFIDTLFLRRLIICIGVIDFSAQGRHNLLNFMDNFNICQNSIKSHTFTINFF